MPDTVRTAAASLDVAGQVGRGQGGQVLRAGLVRGAGGAQGIPVTVECLRFPAGVAQLAELSTRPATRIGLRYGGPPWAGRPIRQYPTIPILLHAQRHRPQSGPL